MIRMKRFLTFLLLTSNFLLVVSLSNLLLICGQAWGSADTLRPREDGSAFWNHTGCEAGSRYNCVDDIIPDLDTTYAYTSAVSKSEEFWHDSTFVSNIDSVVIRVHAKKTGGTVKIYLGWAYYSEALWHFHVQDTVTLTTSWADYSANLTDEPSWTYQKINSRRFGVRTPFYLSGIWSANVTQVFIIVYYQEAAEEAKKQGGIVQDEDNRGIAEGGIAR